MEFFWAAHGQMNPLAGKQPQLVRVMGDWQWRDLRLVLRHLGVMTLRSRFGRGRRPSSQRADDPCRAIKIVALTGQLCATPQAHA